MKRCVRCIMPETVPGITFDKNGVCSFCQDYNPPSYYGEQALIDTLTNAKKRGSRYDCVVPVSGGRDSTYVLYLAKKVYGMKVLAVNYNNEFATDVAISNLKRACEAVEVDLLSISSKHNYVRKITKYSILAASEFGRFGECVGCTYGYRSAVYRAAVKNKIPLILWGESQQEATANLEINTFNYLRNKKLRFKKLFDINFYKSEFYRLLHRVEFYFSLENVIMRRFEPVLRRTDINQVRLFDYIPWERKKIKETITKELNWKKKDDSSSTWRTDCILVDLINFYYVKLFGCTKLCFGYCNMINSGQITRDEALQQEEYAVANHDRNVKSLLEKEIGLSEKQAGEIVNHPSRVKII